MFIIPIDFNLLLLTDLSLISAEEDIMANSNEMMALSKSFSRLEEERVYQIIDNYLEKNGNPLMIVNALSNGMQEVGQLFKNDE